MVIVTNGIVDLSNPIISKSPIKNSFKVIRIQFNGLVIVFDRLLKFLLFPSLPSI